MVTLVICCPLYVQGMSWTKLDFKFFLDFSVVLLCVQMQNEVKVGAAAA